MKSYTAHLKPGRMPVLVPEAFSWGAALLGPLWFTLHRAWVAAAIHLLLIVALARLLPPRFGAILLGLAWLAGLLGRDVLRWTLDRRGYTLAHVLAARDEETALGRLLTYRPEVAAQFADTLAETVA